MKFFTQIFYARENFGATVLAKTVAPKFSKPRDVLGFDSGAFSAGKAIKLPRRCCKEPSLATSCLRSSTENDFRTRFLLVIIKRTFLELAWKRPEHLIVSKAPNNKTANCFSLTLLSQQTITLSHAQIIQPKKRRPEIRR